MATGMATRREVTLKRIVMASVTGSVLEFYDFFLYAFTAALVFGKLFFPTYTPLAATLASFGTLAVGFIARPLGGILFGHFGDRMGRKAALITTLTLMGGATFAIGLLPVYESIGIAAPIILTVLRFLQGIGLGGEWGGAVLLTLEYSPENKRGYYGSLVQLGALLGLALATAILLIGATLPGNEFIEWGWRIPFLASAILLVLGLYIRMNIAETPDFEAMKKKGTVEALPIAAVMKRHPKQILMTALLYLGGVTVPFYTVWVFLVYYTTAIHKMDRIPILIGVVAANIILLIPTVMAGMLSDKIGRRATYFLGAIVQAAVAFPLFWLTDRADPIMVFIGMLIFGGASWFMWGALAAFAAEQFPAEVRYTGISIGSQAATIIGGFVPMFATAVLPLSGTWPVAMLVVVCALLSAFATFACRDSVTEKRNLPVPASAP